MISKTRIAQAYRFKSGMTTALITAATVLFSLCTDAQVVISEFMAKNDKTLADGNGTYSDWIELYNLGTNSVDLTGWYLSDTTNNLTQWKFPSKSIGAGDFLVVFASGKTAGYTDSLGYLHTSFKLAASGEDVVLTYSDGVTIQSKFTAYPDQTDDVSYGLEQESSTSYLIAEGEDATAYVGTTAGPSSTWNTPSFDDSSWTTGTTGAGYDQGTTYGSMIGLDLESKMIVTKNTTRPPTTTYYNSAYIRVEFSLTDIASISQLTLRMKYDDGFVAYLNGTQVASANAPTSLTYASAATAEHSGSSYEDFTILNAGSYLVVGQNVLAIQGLAYPTTISSGAPGTPTTSTTSDFLILPVLNGISAGSIHTNTALYLTTATPGAANVQGVIGYVGDTSFSVDRGFYTNAFAVEISCETDGAKIYYTIDGTTPSASNGTLYTNAITVSKTTVLRATATKTGYQSSNTDTQTYLFLTDIISQGTSVSSLAPYFPPSSVNGQGFDYGMDTNITRSSTYSNQVEGALKAIPSISIVTDPDNLFNASTGIYVNPENEGDAWERATSVELINPDGTTGFQINAGLRIRGASSSATTNPKHSFRFFFKSAYGTSSLNYPLFGDEGVTRFKNIDLRTGQNFSWANQNPQYATWLYDIFTRDTHRDMGQPYTRGEYYHLYINGMYWGLYQTDERANADYAESYYGDDADDFDAVKADADTGIMYATDGTRSAYDTLWTNIYAGVSANSAYFKLQGMNADGTANSSYTKLLDVDNVIDYMMLIFFTANRDGPIGPPNQNTMPRNLVALYNRNDPDGFKFVAHDNEHTLEISEGVSHNRLSYTPGTGFDVVNFFNPWSMHLKLMNNAEYKLRFADHVHEHFFNNGALTATNTASRLETRKNEIYAAVVAESARWGDSTGTLYKRDENWLVQANWLLNTYMPQRTSIVYSQIVAKSWYPTVAAPEFNQHGGSISKGFSLSVSGTGTIYYTTDGTDPRQVGGTAIGNTYGSAISLTRSAQVKARCLSGGVWSALTKATFVVNETSPLRVTEIMYNPAIASTTAEAGYSDSDFEFIELLNTSTQTVGLAGAQFTEGIQFDFTDSAVATLGAGEYAILVSNYEAFTNRYSNWANMKIAGTYHGKFFIPTAALSNDGEEIKLIDGLGNTIQSFKYENWYDLTDGEGYSLTVIDPYAATNTWSVSSSWRPSKYTGGTPGEGDSDFPSPGDLVINEALTHQDQDDPGDWVELYNTSSNAITINGWFISDDADNLTKVTLSELPVIPPHGYLVLTEADHFGKTVAGTNGFALSELGEEVFLSSGENGTLTGYRTSESFGASDRDFTFGRHVKSDGSCDFTAQSRSTYGATNAYPKVGPVVITEIMYHPSSSNGFEYIELCNAGAVDAPLYNTSYPLNTWKLAGAVAFTFPVGTTLAPGACIIITETNAAAFAAYYSVPAGTTVLGPYAGKLANDGEAVELYKPGDPDAETLETPYILVELVEYSDNEPWPIAADGGGSSLERVDTTLYPNDSVNWKANPIPSPGSATYTMADADEDGLPDSWEIYYFGIINAVNGEADDDWDQDWTSNYGEYVADTNPTNALSYFHIESISNAPNLSVSFTSSLSRLYTLYYCTNLTAGSWTSIPTQTDIPGSGGVDTLTDPEPTDAQRFYRLDVSLP